MTEKVFNYGGQEVSDEFNKQIAENKLNKEKKEAEERKARFDSIEVGQPFNYYDDNGKLVQGAVVQSKNPETMTIKPNIEHLPFDYNNEVFIDDVIDNFTPKEVSES